MKKIKFNIKYRKDIEDGKLVPMYDDKVVEILKWDAKTPFGCIIGCYGDDDMVYSWDKFGNNSYIGDLYLVEADSGMTELEDAIIRLQFPGCDTFQIEKNEDVLACAKATAEKFLAIARKQLEPEIDKAYKNQDEVVYRNGQRYVLDKLEGFMNMFRKCIEDEETMLKANRVLGETFGKRATED